MEKLRDFFTAPVFEDTDKTRQARMLNAMLLVPLLGCLVVGGFLAATRLLPWYTLAYLFILYLFMITPLLIMRRGQIKLACLWFLAVGFFAMTAINTYIFNGLESPMMDAYMLLVVAAGLLLGRKALVTFTGLSLFSIVGMYLLRDHLPHLFWVSINHFPFHLLNTTLAAALVYIAIRNVEEGFEEARQHELRLEEKNRELLNIRQNLEKLVEERTIEILKQKLFFEALVNNSPVAIVTLDPEHKIAACNPAFENLFGYTQAEITHQDLDELITDDAAHTEAQGYTQQVLKGSTIHTIGRRRRKDGSLVDVEIQGVPIMVDGVQNGALAIYNDITERKKTEEKLRLNAQVFDSTKEGIIITDSQGNIITANTAFTTITGYALEEIIGKNPRILKSGQQSDEFYWEMWETLLNTGLWQGEVWNRRKDGHVYPEWLTISAVKDNNSKIVNYVGIFSDISSRKEIEEYFKYIATHDALTDLPNRALFHDRLAHALDLAQRNNWLMALLFIDLDKFKAINDTFGHEAGDLVLKAIANRYKDCIRKSDTVARLGGDEFAVVIDNHPTETDINHVANRILAVSSQPIVMPNGENTTISASIGISYFPKDGQTADDLMRLADGAMYLAKETGKNRIKFSS